MSKRSNHTTEVHALPSNVCILPNAIASSIPTAPNTLPMVRAEPPSYASKTSSNLKALRFTPSDAFHGRWKNYVKKAKQLWSKLSEVELLKTAGGEAELTDLVQLRYGLSYPAAAQQVKLFIEQCNH